MVTVDPSGIQLFPPGKHTCIAVACTESLVDQFSEFLYGCAVAYHLLQSVQEAKETHVYFQTWHLPLSTVYLGFWENMLLS